MKRKPINEEAKSLFFTGFSIGILTVPIAFLIAGLNIINLITLNTTICSGIIVGSGLSLLSLFGRKKE